MISFDDFKKVEIKIGKVLSAERIPDSDKLIKLVFDLGDEERQIVSGIAQSFPDPSVLIGKELPLVTNLEPRELRGNMSNGMLLVTTDTEGKIVLVQPEKEVSPGSMVK